MSATFENRSAWGRGLTLAVEEIGSGLAQVAEGIARWACGPDGRKLLSILAGVAKAQPTVEAVHAVLIEGRQEPADLKRLARALGVKHRYPGAAVVLAVGEVHERQRVRFGTRWEKFPGSLTPAQIVPSKNLGLGELMRWLRKEVYSGLPASPKRKTRGRAARARPAPVEVERIAAPAPVEARLVDGSAVDELRRLLAGRVPPRELDLLAMRLESRSTAEAARRLGISPSTARQYVFRLRGRRLPPAVREYLTSL